MNNLFFHNSEFEIIVGLTLFTSIIITNVRKGQTLMRFYIINHAAMFSI